MLKFPLVLSLSFSGCSAGEDKSGRSEERVVVSISSSPGLRWGEARCDGEDGGSGEVAAVGEDADAVCTTT